MNGTLLAVILALAWALLATFWLLRTKPAPATRKGRRQDFVTSEELEDALAKHREALEWEWTEMYEKFNNLHLRLSKREARRKKTEDVEQVEGEVDPSQLVFGAGHRSALPFRRLGSP